MPSFNHFTLRTPRLLLRPLREADAPALFAIFSDARVSRYLSRPAWTELQLAHERITRDIEAMATGKYVRFGLEPLDGAPIIGECCLFNWVEPSRRAEIGYALGTSAWGKGHMGEALAALVEFGFSEMALNRIEADIDPRNTASAKILDQLGFRQEGLLRERWVVAGEVSDTGLYGLLASDWRAARK
ncbi:MAG: GNAT family protein [Ramlibacter sp.]